MHGRSVDIHPSIVAAPATATPASPPSAPTTSSSTSASRPLDVICRIHARWSDEHSRTSVLCEDVVRAKFPARRLAYPSNYSAQYTHEPLELSPSMRTSTESLSMAAFSKRPARVAFTPPTTATLSVRPSAGCPSNLDTADWASFSCLNVTRTVTGSRLYRMDFVIGPHLLKMA